MRELTLSMSTIGVYCDSGEGMVVLGRGGRLGSPVAVGLAEGLSAYLYIAIVGNARCANYLIMQCVIAVRALGYHHHSAG